MRVSVFTDYTHTKFKIHLENTHLTAAPPPPPPPPRAPRTGGGGGGGAVFTPAPTARARETGRSRDRFRSRQRIKINMSLRHAGLNYVCIYIRQYCTDECEPSRRNTLVVSTIRPT